MLYVFEKVSVIHQFLVCLVKCPGEIIRFRKGMRDALFIGPCSFFEWACLSNGHSKSNVDGKCGMDISNPSQSALPTRHVLGRCQSGLGNLVLPTSLNIGPWRVRHSVMAWRTTAGLISHTSAIFMDCWHLKHGQAWSSVGDLIVTPVPITGYVVHLASGSWLGSGEQPNSGGANLLWRPADLLEVCRSVIVLI